MPNRMKHQKDHTLESIAGLKFETCLFRCATFSLQFEHQDDVIEGGEEIKRQAEFLLMFLHLRQLGEIQDAKQVA